MAQRSRRWRRGSKCNSGFSGSSGKAEAGAGSKSVDQLMTEGRRDPGSYHHITKLGACLVKIAGAVTDVGGPMCHGAIVCRELAYHCRRNRERISS